MVKHRSPFLISFELMSPSESKIKAKFDQLNLDAENLKFDPSKFEDELNSKESVFHQCFETAEGERVDVCKDKTFGQTVMKLTKHGAMYYRRESENNDIMHHQTGDDGTLIGEICSDHSRVLQYFMMHGCGYIESKEGEVNKFDAKFLAHQVFEVNVEEFKHGKHQHQLIYNQSLQHKAFDLEANHIEVNFKKDGQLELNHFSNTGECVQINNDMKGDDKVEDTQDAFNIEVDKIKYNIL